MSNTEERNEARRRRIEEAEAKAADGKHSVRAWARGRVCGDCGNPVWGDAEYCRQHYYERLRSGSPEIVKIRMTISDWSTLDDGVRVRTIRNDG
jgi:hypothetical protein